MGEYQTTRTARLLVEENRHLLQQGIDLIGTLSESIYRLNEHAHFSSGVGKHFRHILDFYDRFLAGDQGLIDYDARARDERLETDPAYAADRARHMMDGLTRSITNPRLVSDSQLDTGSARIAVRVETCAPDGVGLTTESSIERELAHLASHTTHHYAIIRLVLSILGTVVPEDFGIAPSTRRHEKRITES